MSVLSMWWTERGHEGRDHCRKCGLSFDGFRNEDRVCDAAQPGKVEWIGTMTAGHVGDLSLVISDDASSGPATQEPRDWQPPTAEDYPLPPLPRSTDAEMVRKLSRPDGVMSVLTSDELARAMSTPLPHDPPMSARLMPWRGR